jgi:hypothetical protein
MPVQSAPTPTEINDFGNALGNRIEAATIMGGDYGIGGSTYTATANGNDAKINTTITFDPSLSGATITLASGELLLNRKLPIHPAHSVISSHKRARAGSPTRKSPC